MSILDDGKLQKLFGQVLGNKKLFGEDMTLRSRTTTINADGVSSAAFTSATVRGTRTGISKRRRENDRIPEEQDELIVCQYGAAATPERGFQIIVRSETFEILSVDPDPAAATWVLRVVLL